MTPAMYSLAETFIKYALWPALGILIICYYKNEIRALINKIILAPKMKFNAGLVALETEENQNPIKEANLDEKSKLDLQPSAEIPDRDHTHWYAPVKLLLEENKVKEAREAFLAFTRENKEISYDSEYAFFCYILFEQTQDEKTLSELLKLTQQTKDIDSKNEYINSYVYCLEHTNQFSKAINFLLNEISMAQDIKSKAKYIILLSKNYLLNLEKSKAESVVADLIQELTETHSEDLEEEFYLSYLQMAEIENKKNNKVDYALCLDKALEYKPSRTETLFSAAYQASKLPFLESIAISNYSHLNNLAPKNEAAINNLGVAANKLNLKITACDYYHQAKDLNSSISFSNIGYKLLEAGCAKEAKELASYAITLPDPDKNNYELLAKIKKECEEEQDKWSQYKMKSIEKQKIIRSYIEKKYTSKIILPRDSLWKNESNYNVNVDIKDDEIHISWKENNKETNVWGTIVKSVFSGVYSSKDSGAGTLLGGSTKSTTAHCIGIYDELEDSILIISTDVEKDIKLILTKRKDV